MKTFLRALGLVISLLYAHLSWAQFQFSDNASNYSGTWANGNNFGTGYNAWAITSGGPNAGTFIGNPASNGMGTAGIGTTAFGLFGHSGQYVNAVRFFGAGGTNVPMQIGDVFSFHWAMNWDAGGGSKGFDLRADGTTVFNVNNGGSANIQTTNGSADGSYGTNPMLVTLTRTSWTEYTFTMTRRSNGSTYSTTIASSANINNINIYCGDQPDNNGNRNIYFNNFNFTKAAPYETNFNVTEPRILTGSSNLTKTGTGNLTLTAANTFTGNVIVNANFLIISNDNQLGAVPGAASADKIQIGDGTLGMNGTITIHANRGMTLHAASSTIDVFGGQTATYNGIIAGTGGLTKAGPGTLVIGGANTYTGSTTVSNHVLRITNDSALGASTAGTTVNSGCAVEFSGAFSPVAEPFTINGFGVSNGGALRNVTNNTRTISGLVLLNSDARINSDNATLTLSNVNVNSFTLYTGGAGSVHLSTTLLNGSKTTGDGAIFKDGAGELRLGGGFTALTGTVNLTAGTIRMNDNAALGNTGTLNMSGGTTLRPDNTIPRTTSKAVNINGDITLGYSGAGLTLTGSINLNGGIRTITSLFGNTISGSISNGSLTKVGAGNLTLSGTNTYAGDTRINEGNLTAGSAGAFGGGTDVYIANGATLTVSASTSAASVREAGFSNSGTAVLNAGTVLTINGVNKGTFFQNSISGAGGLTMAGSGTTHMSLFGTQSYTGATTVTGATLTSGVPMSTGSLTVGGGSFVTTIANVLGDNIPVTVNGGTYNMGGNDQVGSVAGTVGGTINLNAHTLTTGTNNSNTSFSGIIAGTGNITKIGTGIWTIGGQNTFSGLTTISDGTLSMAGTSFTDNTIPGDILIDGGTLQYGNTADGQIADASNITLSSGIFNAGARIETVASITMTGGTLTKGSNNLVFNNPSSITGGNVLMTAGGGYVFNGDLTLGNTTVNNTASGTSGGNFRIGGTVTVNPGTNPSFIDTGGGTALRFNLNNAIRTFDVGAGANLTIDWRINSTTASLGGIVKTGAGTMTLTAPNNTLYTGTTTISAGELRLNPTADGTMNSQFVMNGGALATTGIAAGRVFTNSSTLRLDNTSTIALGSNAHELRFANSSSVTWNGSATLTITGWTGAAGNPGSAGRIFVGAAANHLTNAQLDQITFSGYGPAILLSNGELVPRHPEISVTIPGTILFPFTTPEGGPSAEQTFSVSGSQLIDNIVLTAPAGYEISLTSGSGFTNTLNLTPTSFTVNTTTIYVRLIGTAAGYANGIVTATSTGATTQNAPLHGAVLTADAIVINFDNASLWTNGSAALNAYATDHQYNQFNWNFTGGPALRDGTASQDGFPSALNAHSWRLRETDNPDWRATFTQGGTLTSFGFKVRRWDNSPDPNYAVQFSTDGGATWSAVLATINNAFLADGSQWRVFNHIVSPAVDIDPGDLVIRVLSSGGERIMIDDFHYDIAVCTNTTWHYRSVANGNWADFNTWEHSIDGNAPWSPCTCGPTAASASIAIRNGHSVVLNTSVTLDQTTIENGGSLRYTGGNLTINDGTGDDLVVQAGGVFEIGPAPIPVYQNANVRIRVQTGGTLSITSGATSGISTAMAGNGSSNRIIYEHQSVFEWANSSSFATANMTYFPDVDASTIPIFRTSVNTATVGSSNPTVILGLYEANGNTTWANAGNKTFRNGITGSGNVSQSGGTQFLIINGTTAQLGGTGVISTNGNGLTISTGASCDLISSKTVSGGPLVIGGTLNAGTHSLNGAYSGITVTASGRVNTSNPNGLQATGGTFTNTTPIPNLNAASTIDYQLAGDQVVTTTANYGNLILSGSGNKRFNGNVTILNNLTIQDAAQVHATGSLDIVHQGNMTMSGTAGFTSGANDHIRWSATSVNTQLYTGNGNPVRLFRFTSNKATPSRFFDLASAVTPFDIKEDFSLSYNSGSIFRDNGNTISVGGNAILEGASTAVVLTGTLEMNGANGTPQVIESSPGDAITTHLNNLRIVGTSTDVAFSPSSGTQTIRINGNVDIQAGVLRPRSNILDLRGNWTNYNQSGLAEAGSRLLFQGNAAQSITCPGGEVLNFLSVTKSGGSFQLNHNVTVNGSGADVATFTNGVPVNLNGQRLSFAGASGGSIRMSTGQVTFTGPAGSEIEIDNSDKVFEGVSSGSCLIDDNVVLNLRRGLNCGALGLTLLEGTLQISNMGFVNTNPPNYADNSTLRYATTGAYNRGNEWNTVSANIGYPFHVQVFGTNPLNMGSGATNRGIRGNLTIDQGGALNMQTMSGNLEVLGNVNIGGTANGALTLSSTFDGDLLVGGNLVRHASNGTFTQNNREVEMIGNGNIQTIENIPSFTFLAINNNGGQVRPNVTTTINNRLRLGNGTLDLITPDVNVIMANEAAVWRTFGPATMNRSPITAGLNRYNIQYRDNAFTTALEWSPIDSLVADVTFEVTGTTTLGANRTFNRSMFLNGSNLDLGGNVLTARGRTDNLSGNAGDIAANQAGVRNITGPAGSRLDIIGLGETGETFRTKRFVRNDGATLTIGPNVEVRIGNGGCDFGIGNPVTIEGVLSVRGGGYAINNACFYAPNSILRFSNGFDYIVNPSDITWRPGDITSSDPGIPYNVEVLGSTTELFMNSARSLRNNLRIIDGQFTLTTNSGTFAIGGDWIREGTTSAFNHNQQKVIFDGTGPQTIATLNITGTGGETFWDVAFDRTGTKTLNEAVTVLKDLEILGTGPLVGNNQTITIRGTWNNDVGPASFNEAGSTVVFTNDTIANAITAVGGEDFHNLIVNNTFGASGSLSLNNDIRVGNVLTFTNGIIRTNGNQVEFKNGAAYTGAGNGRFVDGWVRKTGYNGTNFFEFPVGYTDYTDPGNPIEVYMPAGVRAVSASTTAAWRVRYYHQNHNPAFTTAPGNRPPVTLPLTNVSTCNWWDVDRVEGTINGDVRLYWDQASDCYDVSNPDVLTVAHWNGSTWQTSASAPTVTVLSVNDRGFTQTGPFTSFSPFTIGSNGPGNVLPITLLSFTARATPAGTVETAWTTASEVNNDFFTVERSRNGNQWEAVGHIEGAGNSTTVLNYTFTDDAPHSGSSYYRLRQTDFDGTFTLTDPQVVHIGSHTGALALHNVYISNQGTELVYTASAPYLTVEVFDVSGRLVHAEVVENDEGHSTIQPNIARGVYLLRLSDHRESSTMRFFR